MSPDRKAPILHATEPEPLWWLLLLEGLRSNSSGPQSLESILAIVRRGRASGYELDEESTRSLMRRIGIDAGPVWDRPLRPDPQRMPIRPEALTRLEGLLSRAAGEASATRVGPARG